jgi:hypothetical protein
MEARGEEMRTLVAPKNGELRQRVEEKDRDYERRLFSEALRLNLREFFLLYLIGCCTKET